MPAEGGPARRMTWLGPDVIVRGWTPDGHILFVTTYGQPFFRNYRAHTLDPAGGMPQMLPLGQVNHLAFGPGKARLIGRNTADPARWKRYRGGTVGHLWIDADGTGAFRRMTELPGNITSPMWVGDRIHYLSDAEGVGNLYSCLPDGSDVRRHSDHDDFYARHAQTDGKRIVYQCGADVWLFDPASDRTVRVDIDVPSHRTQAARKFVPAADHLGAVHVHPEGHSLAVEARGKLFTFPLWEGAVRQHGAADGVRYRHGQWLADGATLVAIDDESGDERVTVIADGVARSLPVGCRARGCAARGAQRHPRRDCQSSQRGVDRRRCQRRVGGRRSQRRGPHRGPRVVARCGVARVFVLDESRGIARSSSTMSRARRAASSRTPSSAITVRPSIRKVVSSTFCRSGRSTRSTTACNSS